MQDSKILLKTERAAWQMSQSEFAALLNIPVRTLQNWEAGRKPPDQLLTLLLCLQLVRLIEAEAQQQGNSSMLAIIADFPALADALRKIT